MHIISIIVSMLMVNIVFGQTRQQPQASGSPQQGLEQQQQYFGSQPGFRTVATPVKEPQDENQNQGNANDVEQTQFLNFVQQQGLLRRQNPFVHQLQQFPSEQQQQLEQQRLGIPQNKQNIQQQELQAIQQQRLLQQQQILQQLLHQQQVQQQRFTAPQLQQNQLPQQVQQTQQPQQVRQQSLLGVAYSPSNKVAQTRYVSNGVSYSFR